MQLSKCSVIRLAVILTIILIVALLWIVKNNGQDVETLDPSASTTAISSPIDSAPAAPNADFNLFVTEPIDFDRLMGYGLPILIDFGADSCIPCKEMAPVLKKLNAELQGKAIIKFVDVWKDQSLAGGLPLRVIPTQFLFNADGSPYVPADPENSGMLMYELAETGEHMLTAHEGGMTEDMILQVLLEMGMAR